MDSHIGEPERSVQNRLLALFKEKLKYEYLGNYEYRTCNRNIERKLLFDYLMSTKKWSEDEAKRAITKLEKEAYCTPQNMQEKNEKVYSLLRYGANVSPDVGTQKITVNLIDWEHPDKNQFYIAEEVTINSSTPDSFTKRPDLVIYVNGIALAVIELKRSKVSVHDGIRQTIGNQQENFIRPFFSTVQLLFAGNDSQGLYYGVIDTPEKFWLYNLVVSQRFVKELSLRNPLIPAIVTLAVLIGILYWFFGTEYGSGLRATGANRRMASAQGIDTRVTVTVGLMLSNGLVALSGALLAQYQGAVDVNMGRGAIVIGLAAVIIGEVLLGKVFRNFALKLCAVVIGAVIYYMVLQIVLQLGLNTNDLKLFTAAIVALFLSIPCWKNSVRTKKGGVRNA